MLRAEEAMRRVRLTEEQLLDVNDLAALWKVPKSFIYSVTADGRLKAVRIGRYLRYTRESAESFMKAQG